MGYFFSVLGSFLSCRLRQWKSWLLLLLLPGIALAAKNLTAAEPTSPVTVGVVLPAEGAEVFWNLLEDQNSDLLTFVPTDERTLDRNVAAGRWDCGLILPEDFEERIEESDFDRLITLRISSGSAVYPLVRESVSSCLARLASPVIAWDYLLENQIVEKADFARMEDRLDQMRAETKKIGIRLSTPEGSALSVPQILETGSQRFLYWLISAVILIRVLFASADLCCFSTSAAARRLRPIRSSLLLVSARGCADSMLILLSGCSAMVILGGGLRGCGAVVCDTLFWLSVSILLAQFPGIHGALVVFIPAAPVISFLLSSVVVDVSLVLPRAAGLLRWIPVSLFLRICDGDAAAAAALAAAGVVCWLGALALAQLRHR